MMRYGYGHTRKSRKLDTIAPLRILQKREIFLFVFGTVLHIIETIVTVRIRKSYCTI